MSINNIDNSEKEYEEKILKPFEAKREEEVRHPQESQEVKDSNLSQQENLKALPEEFDIKLIGDLDYLREIFSAKYDRFKSLDFLLKTRERMLEEGYPNISTLNEFLFWSTISRRLQIVYQRTHAKLFRKKGVSEDEAENIPLLKEMRAVTEQVSFLQKTLDVSLERKKQTKDVVDLHEETMKEVEEFIKKNAGTFAFKCRKCHAILDSRGLPHFAIITALDDMNEVVYHIFSEEMWFLFRRNLIPLHYIAFMLRTSPEGILYTAELRKEHGSKVLLEDVQMLEAEESALKMLRENYDDFRKEK